MPVERAPADAGRLAPLTRAAFGSQRRLLGVSRLRGGSKKGVYRAAFDGGFSAIIYVWDASEDFWPAAVRTGAGRDPAGPFAHASGLDLFRAANARLSALAVRTPRLYLADASREHYPAEVAVVEDVPGPTLEEVMEAEPNRVPPVMRRLSEALRALHSDKAGGFGKLLHVSNGSPLRGASSERLVLTRALADLAEATVRVPPIAEASARLEHALRESCAGIEPRSEFRLIHGELGPDHVLVDGEQRPVLIDIEGLMYFDPEWEHVFLQLRFGDHYQFLHEPGLDKGRLDLYRLAMHLSLIAGPLRLLDGDFPDREPMLRIVEHNIGQTLSLA
jgi:hypothetical protein